MENLGEHFLHQKHPELHTTNPVTKAYERRVVKSNSVNRRHFGKTERQTVSQKPADKIADWLQIIDKTHTEHRDDPGVMERIKNYYHKEYVIKPEDIPESTFLLEQRIAREEGWGTIEITDAFREQKTEQIITNQKVSLDRWVDYLSSEDAEYPTWAKYWAFTSMVKMGKFEKAEREENGETIESAHFAKRTKDTTASFPVLNSRALAKTMSALQAHLERKKRMASLVFSDSSPLRD